MYTHLLALQGDKSALSGDDGIPTKPFLEKCLEGLFVTRTVDKLTNQKESMHKFLHIHTSMCNQGGIHKYVNESTTTVWVVEGQGAGSGQPEARDPDRRDGSAPQT